MNLTCKKLNMIGIQWLKNFLGLFVDAGIKFTTDSCQRFAAAMSYYMVFSLAPLLIIIVAVLGLYYEGDARLELVHKIEEVASKQIADVINNLILSASKPFQSIFASAIAIITFLVGASRVLVEMRAVLNTIWGFASKGKEAETSIVKQIIQVIVTRLFTMLVLLLLGMAILVMLVASTYFSMMHAWVQTNTTDVIPISQFLTTSFSIVTLTIFFYLVMRVLPAYRPPHRNVLFGAFIAAVLFNFGKILIGLYLARAAATSIYGAASSLVVLMLWIYYSTCIFLYGAQLAACLRLRKLKRIKELLEVRRAQRAQQKASQLNVSALKGDAN